MKRESVIICGDINVATHPIDVAALQVTCSDIAGYTEEERANMLSLLDLVLIDTFRFLYPNAQNYYTFWNNESQRNRNVGWRLDYSLISTSLRNALVSVEHKTDITGSDHCPVLLTLNRKHIENQAKITAFTRRREQFNTNVSQVEDFDLAIFF